MRNKKKTSEKRERRMLKACCSIEKGIEEIKTDLKHYHSDRLKSFTPLGTINLSADNTRLMQLHNQIKPSIWQSYIFLIGTTFLGIKRILWLNTMLQSAEIARFL